MKRIRTVCLLLAVFMAASVLVGCRTGAEMRYTYEKAALYTEGNGSYAAEDVDSVVIDWVVGSVTLIPDDGAELSFSENATSLQPEQQLHSYIDGRTLYIRYCQSEYKGDIPSAQKNLTVEIPTGIPLDVTNISGSVTLRDGTVGESWFITTSADVCFENVIGDELYVYTVSGDLDIASLTAQHLYFSSTSGEMDADVMLVDTPSVEVVSGNVEIDTLYAEAFEIYTTSGSVDLTLAKDAGGWIDTYSGNVKITLPQASNLTVEFVTETGKLRTQRACKAGERKEQYVFGDGTAPVVMIDTLSGNAEIH